MRPIVVTGAKGFIGSSLVPRLAAHSPVCACDFGTVPASTPEVTWLSLDLSRPLDTSALPESPKSVVHLAQSMHHREFPERARDLFAVNVASTFDMLEYARTAGAEAFVFASSGVCGPSEGPIAEEAPLAPSNFYLRTKAACEILAGEYASFFNVALLRFFFPYGPGQRNRLIPDVIARVREGREVLLTGGDGLRLCPMYIDDVAESIARALTVSGLNMLNVAGREAVSLRELAETIGDIIGKTPTFDEQPGAAPSFIADTRRMDAVLGRWERVGLAKGLERTIAGD